MLLLALLAACSGTPGAGTGADSSNAADRVSVSFESGGLPDCVNSVSNEAFCAGWGIPSDGSAHDNAPEWLWPYGPKWIYFAQEEQGEGEFLCADTSSVATAIFDESTGYDLDAVESVQELDPRWFDILFARTDLSYLVFRVPRCSVFRSFANVRGLGASEDQPNVVDALWQVMDLPPDRASFFDIARTLELVRLGTPDGGDYSSLYLMGSQARDETWTFRTCRVNGEPYYWSLGEGLYYHGVWQSDYVMDIATGRVTFTATQVRTVACDHYLSVPPQY